MNFNECAMEVHEFVNLYKEVFGGNVNLPLVFSYSDEAVTEPRAIPGCFFKSFEGAISGEPVTLTVKTIGCGGGKFYTGFTEMPERIPGFVSMKEHYKQTPEQVSAFVEKIQVERTKYTYLNIQRVDRVESLENIEGMIFLATPDVLSGLCGWAFYDNTDDDAVTTIFGSGCSTMFANVTTENRRGGHRCFLGLFDPSVRPHIPAGCLGFGVPKSRLDAMLGTINECFLTNSVAWEKVKKRINQS